MTFQKGHKINNGRKHTYESRKKMSQGHKNHIPWNKGKSNVYSEETKTKMRLARLGKKNRKESIEKMIKSRIKNRKYKDIYYGIGNKNKMRLFKKEKLAKRKRPNNCDICNKVGKICFDHCHKTNKFRGWICHPCNVALGFVNDDIEILKKMIKYLKKDCA